MDVGERLHTDRGIGEDGPYLEHGSDGKRKRIASGTDSNLPGSEAQKIVSSTDADDRRFDGSSLSRAESQLNLSTFSTSPAILGSTPDLAYTESAPSIGFSDTRHPEVLLLSTAWQCRNITHQIPAGYERWIPLENCKSCTQGKRYHASHNAEEHLRRKHFYPQISGPQSQKEGERRGGKRDGKDPDVQYLKDYWIEKTDICHVSNCVCEYAHEDLLDTADRGRGSRSTGASHLDLEMDNLDDWLLSGLGFVFNEPLSEELDRADFANLSQALTDLGFEDLSVLISNGADPLQISEDELLAPGTLRTSSFSGTDLAADGNDTDERYPKLAPRELKPPVPSPDGSAWPDRLRVLWSQSIDVIRTGQDAGSQHRQLTNLLFYLVDAQHDSVRINTARPGFIERCQIHLESSTHTEWEWWPLDSPRRTSYAGWRHISWTCRCGQHRQEQIPAGLAASLGMMLDDFKTKSAAAAAAAAAARGSSSTTPLSSQSQALSQVNQGVTLHTAASQPYTPTNIIPISSVGSTSTISTQTLNPTRNHRHVFLSVTNSGTRYLSQMVTTGNLVDGFVDDDGFFEKLGSEYIRLKGWFRTCFGVYRYAGCEYVKFEKIDDRVHIKLDKGLPDRSHIDYEYTPRPPDEIPPVHRSEFLHRFKNGRRSDKNRRWLALPSKKPQSCRDVQDALRRTPKRDREVTEDGYSREYFWGLSAVERPGALHVFVYHLIVIAGCVAFWIWWQQGHPDDLQNASVPMMVAVTSAALLLSGWKLQTTSILEK